MNGLRPPESAASRRLRHRWSGVVLALALVGVADAQSVRTVNIGPVTIKAQPAATGCMEFILTSSSTDSIDVTIEYHYNAPDPGPTGLGGYASGITLANLGLVSLRREPTHPGQYFNCRKPYEFFFKAKTDNVSQRQRDYEAGQRHAQEQRERERQQRELERQQAREQAQRQQQQFQEMQRQTERERLREFAREHPRCIVSNQADIALCLQAERRMAEDARRQQEADRQRQLELEREAEDRRRAEENRIRADQMNAQANRIAMLQRIDPCRAAEEHIAQRPPPPVISPSMPPQQVNSMMDQYRQFLVQFDLMQKSMEQKCIASRQQRNNP